MVTDINSEDRLVQRTFAEHLEHELGWASVYAYNQETFGPDGTLGRADTSEMVLTRDLRAAIERLNPQLPAEAVDDVLRRLTRNDFSRSLLQHNQEFYQFIRDGVPVKYRGAQGQLREPRARVIDFRNPTNNRFLAVRELKITGRRTPHYNRRADLVCFVNGLPLVFIELKAVYKNIRQGFEQNLRDYLDENVIAHAFHHNAFLVVSNGDRARYGSITSEWEHFAEWKRRDEADKGSLEARVLLDGMLEKSRLLDLVEKAGAKAAWIIAPTGPLDAVTRRGDIVIDQHWRLGDAIVTVPGYDVRILPPSAVTQLACYWAVVGEAAARKGE